MLTASGTWPASWQPSTQPLSNQTRIAAAAWRREIGRPRECVDEIDDHGDWAASEATHLLDAAGAPAGQGTAIKGDQ